MIRMTSVSAFAVAVAMGPAFAEVSSAELDAISIPDKVETSIGTLEFFDGVPTDATVAARLRQPRPHARRGGVSRQRRRGLDVQRAQGIGRCRGRGREQDRDLRTAAGFPDARRDRQYLDPLRLYLYRSCTGRADRHRDPARHARLSERRLAALRREHGRHRAGRGQGRQVSRGASRLRRRHSGRILPAQTRDEQELHVPARIDREGPGACGGEHHLPRCGSIR